MVEIWWICDWNVTYPQVKQMAQPGRTLNSSSALLSMNSTLVFSAVNTNRFRVTYSAMVVDATYQDVAVGHTLVPAFGQEAHSNVSVPTLLIMDKVSLVRPTGADLLEDATNDQFPLYLTGRMDTYVHTFGFKSPGIHVCCVCTLPQFGSFEFPLCCWIGTCDTKNFWLFDFCWLRSSFWNSNPDCWVDGLFCFIAQIELRCVIVLRYHELKLASKQCGANAVHSWPRMHGIWQSTQIGLHLIISQKTFFCTYLLRPLFFRTRCDSMHGLGETTSILKPEKKCESWAVRIAGMWSPSMPLDISVHEPFSYIVRPNCGMDAHLLRAFL